MPLCNCNNAKFTRNFSGLVEQVVGVKKYNHQVMTQLETLRNSYEDLIKKHKSLCQARRKEASLQLAARRKLIEEKDLEISVEKERQRQCEEKLHQIKNSLQAELDRARKSECALREAVVTERMELYDYKRKNKTVIQTKTDELEALLRSLRQKQANLMEAKKQCDALKDLMNALRQKLAEQQREKARLKEIENGQEREKTLLQEALRNLKNAANKLQKDLSCQRATSCAVTAVAQNLQRENQKLKSEALDMQKHLKVSETKRQLVKERMGAKKMKQHFDKMMEFTKKQEDKVKRLAIDAQKITKRYMCTFKKGKCPSAPDAVEADRLLKKVIQLVGHRVPKEICDAKLANPNYYGRKMLKIYRGSCPTPVFQAQN